MIPGLGLTLALLAVVCFGDELRNNFAATPAPPAANNTAASVTASSAAMVPSVGRIPAADVDEEAPGPVRQLLSRLESGSEFLHSTPRYAATFTQQVHKDGRLLDPEQIEIKVQHKPFAVFMKWVEDGQHALYVDGEHDNKLLVHPTRGFGRLRRVWVLDPDSSLAMRGARRPVTEIGLLNMVNLLLGFHREHILCSNCVARMEEAGDADTTRYTLTFDGPHQNPFFAKTILWLCNDRHIPLKIENYSWTDDDRVGPLLESYRYSDICVEDCAVAADFVRENEAYRF